MPSAIQDMKKELAKLKGMKDRVSMSRSVPKIPKLLTGSPIFDSVCGIPRGKITEFFGPPKHGKSTFCWLIIAENTIYAPAEPLHVLYLNKEGRVDPVWLKSLGLPMAINPKSGEYEFGGMSGNDFVPFADENGDPYIDITTTADGEATLELINMAIGVYDLIVVDSLAMVTPASIMQQKLEKASRVGAQSSLLTVWIQQVIPKLEEAGSKTTLIWVNQVRDNIGAGAYDMKTHSPGGNAAHHSMALQIEFTAKKDIFSDAEWTVHEGLTIRMMKRMSSVSTPRGGSFQVSIARLGPGSYGIDRAKELFLIAKRIQGVFVKKDGLPMTVVKGVAHYMRDGEIIPLGNGEANIIAALSNPEHFNYLYAVIRSRMDAGEPLVTQDGKSLTDDDSDQSDETEGRFND